MPINTLDHVNIRTALLAETYAFYAELLGLTLSLAPGAKDTGMGAWLYDKSQRPVLHVGGVDVNYGDDSKGRPAKHGSGAVHHIAFDCSGYADMLDKLEKMGLVARTNDVASIGLRQIFIEDPNGVLVELNFRAD